MAFTVEPVTLKQIAEHTNQELADGIQLFFIENPKKTVIKIADEFSVRKSLTDIGKYEIHPN